MHDDMAYELRIACMRLARRIRYTTSQQPPHFFSVLAWLADGPTTARDLACKERVSAASMSRTIAEMTERGLVARTTDPHDKRCQVLSITDQGSAAIANGRAERDQWMAAHLEQLTPDDLAALRRATEIINRLLEEDPS